jgi:HD superfamily phosphohydrolase
MHPIFERMLSALEEKRDDEILRFDDFQIIQKLGRGQQGLVALATNPNGKQFAVKFFCPSFEPFQAVSKERFIREIQILLKLKHRNIVSIYAAGSAKWDDTINKWRTSPKFGDMNEVLYYVMEYIEGKKVKEIFYKNIEHYEPSLQKCAQKNLGLFEQLIVQISTAMTFFHEKEIVHRDITPDNIIYSEQDGTFVIVDFGFAMYLKSPPLSDPQNIRKQAFLDFASAQEGKMDQIADQYSFAKMLSGLLDSFSLCYTDQRYRGIRMVLDKAMMEKREERYKSMAKFIATLAPYLYSHPYNYVFQIGSFLIPRTRFGSFTGRINIPCSGFVPTFKEMLDIVDTAEFQRLRGVRQLGPTHFVYPGATHTRFEHSLGTYCLSLKYLGVLLRNPKFCDLADPVEESVKIVALSTLLHDIGHYPYSHWIEELAETGDKFFESHEQRAALIIQNSKIGRIISEDWGIDPSVVGRLISRKTSGGKENLLGSIVDSVIDVDKVDYLQRDSAHCGVPYGQAIDANRLISSLFVDPKNNRICLIEKGRSSFVGLMTSNIIMYQEVYWHKTVRACTAMFKRFFFQFIEENKDMVKTIRDQYLSYPDERFIETLFSRTQDNPELNRLISPFANQGRALFKPAYVYYPTHSIHDQSGSTKKLFGEISNGSYSCKMKIAAELVDVLKKHVSEASNMEQLDIILETAPVDYREVAELDGFRLYDSRIGEFEVLSPEIMQLNDYLRKNRSSYVLCSPNFYSKLKKLSVREWSDIFSSVLRRL